jgi:hypothetical protein
MIENSIQQFRAKRRSASQRVNTGDVTKQRLGLAQRELARSEDETSRALERAGEAQEAQYNPADSINSWADSIDSLRAERASRERSTTGALDMSPISNSSSGGRPRSRSGVGDSTYAEEIRQGLVDRGMPDHIARGFVMNFRDESGLNPDINEAEPLVEGSRGGFGLYQLTGPRRKDYEAMADERGVPYGDTDAQLDWLMIEYNGSESSAAERINATETPGGAAAAIVQYFLRPSPEHVTSRTAKYLNRT